MYRGTLVLLRSCGQVRRRFRSGVLRSAAACVSAALGLGRRLPAAGCGALSVRSASRLDPSGELCERRLLREASGRCAHLRRHPLRKRDFARHVTSRTRMHLAHPREAIGWQPPRRPDKRGPHPPMHQCDLVLDETAHQDLVALADCPRHGEDFLASPVRPPAAPNGLSGDGRGKRRHRPLRGLENHTVPPNESESLACAHHHLICRSAQRSQSAACRSWPAGCITRLVLKRLRRALRARSCARALE